MVQQQIIGARAFVSFPLDSDQQVPAKVDTGADYSSVWASDIKEEGGVLSYTLFAPTSRYYTGVVHTSTEYDVTQVKNSFGHTELRYKTEITVRIEGRRIKARFNLSDRSRNRYPILVGKRTLSGKFLVDTTHTPRSEVAPEIKVLMLNSLDSEIVKEFADSLTKATPNLTCDYSPYDDLILVLENEKQPLIIRNSTNEALENFDLVYLKTHYKRQEFAAALSEAFDGLGVQYIDQEIRNHVSNGKVSQYARLHSVGVSLPKTVMINTSILSTQYDRFVSLLGLPFVLKDPAADKGLRNYLIRNPDDFSRAVALTEPQQLYFVAQEFIENTGDLRVVVFDKKVELVIGRRAAEDSDTHLNNTSTGGSAVLVPLDEFDSELKSMSVRAAIALNRQVAGVDLIKDEKTGKWYILEVNNAPQIASGAFQEEKIKLFGKFLRRYADK